MVGPIEHGADQVVEARIHTGEDRGSGLFDHIDLGQKISGLADQEFSGLKGQGELFAILRAEPIETVGEFFAQFLDICLYVPILVGYLETAPKIKELQVLEVPGGIEQDFGGVKEDIDVQDIAARVHMDSVDVH